MMFGGKAPIHKTVGVEVRRCLYVLSQCWQLSHSSKVGVSAFDNKDFPLKIEEVSFFS